MQNLRMVAAGLVIAGLIMTVSGCVFVQANEPLNRADPPVIVDISDILERGRGGFSQLEQCCVSERRELACHAYDCGDESKGCIRWCRDN